MMTGINESKTLTNHLTSKCKCRFNGKNGIQNNGGITINAYVSVKKFMYVKKIMFGILLHKFLKMENI